MHGIEHCEQKRRTIRLSAPQRPFSPAPGSMLPGSPLAASCPEPVARNGFLLARDGCHLSATSIPGSKLSACYFASFQVASVPVRPFGSTTASPVCAGGGRFTASGPLHFHFSVQPAAPAISTPLRDFCLPRDQSVQSLLLPAGPPDESARFPLAPRRPFLVKVGAADHRSRSASFPPACCSSNLLEPFSLCSRCAFPSTLFVCQTSLFLSIYIVYFQSLIGDAERKSCE
jgi:hypothetical protein